MYSGVFPILPTTFDEQGDLDLGSQKRAVDFLIDAGVDGICILANYSEQFALTDSEREQLTQLIIDHVAGRAPVIVTTSHFSTRVAAARSRQAQELGAQMVMLMPPYHGTTLRPTEEGVMEFFRTVAAAIDIPILIQDAPVSGVPLSAALLARLAAEIGRVRYFKVEVPGAAAKLRELIRLGGATIEGPFDGEESITLMADLDAGATGTMPSAMIPEVLGQVVRLYQAGQREEATALYERYLPLINFENKQCGLLAAKALMREGGIIESEAVRHPLLPLHPATRAGLVELARRLDPLILHWST
ncbi:MAG TPA: dihydrodipicolinate synthase family protein [Chloroflexota bacterium]|nr:dihydrodipicolinate synthase family protein [Chloroflexota bacterium]